MNPEMYSVDPDLAAARDAISNSSTRAATVVPAPAPAVDPTAALLAELEEVRAREAALREGTEEQMSRFIDALASVPELVIRALDERAARPKAPEAASPGTAAAQTANTNTATGRVHIDRHGREHTGIGRGTAAWFGMKVRN